MALDMTDTGQISVAWSLCRDRFSTAEGARDKGDNVRQPDLLAKVTVALELDFTYYGSRTLFYNVLRKKHYEMA
jgi:hypothetical protein